MISTLIVALAVSQNYRFPIELPAAGATQPYITAYRDHDGGGGLQDWNCGTDTYNGHRGTDIGIGGFAVMDAGSRWVVAAADGEVTFANDGCFDRCTNASCDCGAGFGNYVQITHADGKRTYYGHMMNGSIQVSVGDRVGCGQRLGKVASSGYSTGPHLHFEPRYSNNVSDEPFSGPCGGPSSFWVAQGPYGGLPEERCEGGAPPPPPPPPPPEDGGIKGVVWDRSITDGPNDGGNVRLAGTMLSVEGGPTTTSRDGDAYWSFALPAGTYRVAATRDGYEIATREVIVTAGTESWASMGLEPLEIGVVDPPPANDAREPRRADIAPETMEMPAFEGTITAEAGGCACVRARATPALLLLLLLAMFPLLRARARSA